MRILIRGVSSMEGKEEMSLTNEQGTTSVYP